MQTRGFWTLREVSDGELEAGLKSLLRAGARTEARVVAHLAEIDARRLTLSGGQSLFEYCQKCLGFSESEAWYRICAARTARRFPMVFELLERRELHLTAIALIAKYLTEENHRELLVEVRGKTKRQILELLVQRFPRADVASSFRKLPTPAHAIAAGPTGSLEPLSPQNYLLQLMISARLQAKLELARDLMSHANPSGDLAVVVERAVDLLLEKLQARRFGQPKRVVAEPTRLEVAPETRKVGTSAPNGGPRKRRHISNHVKRQVAARDGLCCTYVGSDGQRCCSSAFLEFDHRVAWAKGGSDSMHNLRLLCRAHNQLLADREFGPSSPRKHAAHPP